MSPRVRRALLLPFLALVLAACQLQVDVNVTVAKDGSGTVEAVATLDAAAVANVGGDLARVLSLDALRSEGWTIVGPTRRVDGHTVLRVRRAFHDPAGAATAFAQLSGKGGPFQGFAVTRRSSLTRTRWGFTGAVDLERGAGTRGAPTDQDLAKLADQLGTSLSRLVQVRVRVLLPGHVSSNATTKAANGASWQLAFGQPLHLEAHGTQRHAAPYVLAALGAVLALVLLMYALVRVAHRATAAEARDLRR